MKLRHEKNTLSLEKRTAKRNNYDNIMLQLCSDYVLCMTSHMEDEDEDEDILPGIT
uniref:Uncharacterized protein n=1 Tax=viral metagenome TaxID=1070528 RepID=A0A6M3L9M4_9ZZZZ